MDISGNTRLIAHLGYPTATFKAPMIYNPWFDSQGIDIKVVPMGVKAEDYAQLIPSLFRMTNIIGALVTMPHKVSTCELVHSLSPTAQIAGACNAIRLEPDGTLRGDMFDGDGFVRGVLRKGVQVEGARALVVGSGGVGSAIAASLAAAGIDTLALFDKRADSCEELAKRLRRHYPALRVLTGVRNPKDFSIVVNATPLGMNSSDELPLDVFAITPGSFVGEVVMKNEITPFLHAATQRDCQIQPGTDMLFEMIPAYMAFFGLPEVTPEMLRNVAKIDY
ncbi:shikimate 5-dehydrogenase I alpha [Buttiauxella brennerae ATCC 51605]|uniref:Shikimate 5-dehydrogenase I alpha n=1 Tax=Buttiauxella brennerae ATCC 51605 TaxID=1354251 RepID=A0A1B7IE64_9ENTR|nr:shikimate dehydrogenase [Buttiauxella brennerae]OAT27614.1 shikimate 5-dehydrogenase I alpha [Buttiauxella brennerae ATCC 51605]